MTLEKFCWEHLSHILYNICIPKNDYVTFALNIVPFTNESEQFSSVQNRINIERNIELRNVVLIWTLHEAVIFLYVKKKMCDIRWTPPVFLHFQKSTMQNSLRQLWHFSGKNQGWSIWSLVLLSAVIYIFVSFQFNVKEEVFTWAFSVLHHSWKCRHCQLQSIVNLETCHSAEKRLKVGLTLQFLEDRWTYGPEHWPAEWQALVLCESFQSLVLRHCLFKQLL